MTRPWLALYVTDYLADTRDLDATQHGVYLLLLMESWERGPLPNDLGRLCRLAAGAPAPCVRTVLERYWQLTDGAWRNSRLERERAAAESKYQGKVARMAEARARKSQASNQGSNQGGAQGSNQGSGHDSNQALTTALISAAQPQPQPQPQPQILDPPLRSEGGVALDAVVGDRGVRGERLPVARQRAPGAPKPTGSRLPDDWTLPEEWRAWAETHGLNGRVNAEAEKFRDYWVSCAGAKGRKADWQATWRNWCRTALEGRQRSPPREPRGMAAVEALFGAGGDRVLDGEVER